MRHGSRSTHTFAVHPGSAKPPLLKRLAKSIYALVFTVLAGSLGILGYFGCQPGKSSESTQGLGSPGPDPYQYVSLDSTTPPQLSQDCAGLLGLCLGQPFDLARRQYGQVEDQGSPRLEDQGSPRLSVQRPTITCHHWTHPPHLPPVFNSVEVCEKNVKVVSVQLWLSGVAGRLAIPLKNYLAQPTTVAIAAENVRENLTKENGFGMQRPPFEMAHIANEDYWLNLFDWHLISYEEGVPFATLGISGEQRMSSAHPPEADPATCVYNEYLHVSQTTPLTVISIADPELDIRTSSCPGL